MVFSNLYATTNVIYASYRYSQEDSLIRPYCVSSRGSARRSRLHPLRNAERGSSRPRVHPCFSKHLWAPAPFLRALFSNPKFNPNRLNLERLATMSQEELYRAVAKIGFHGFWGRDAMQLNGVVPFLPDVTDKHFTSGSFAIPSFNFVEIAECIPQWKIDEVDKVLTWEDRFSCSTYKQNVFVPVKYLNDDNTLWTEAMRVEPQYALLTAPDELAICHGGSMEGLRANWIHSGGYSDLLHACFEPKLFAYVWYIEM